ncbi:MAG: protealysin inhibitor emfourin [Rhizorhabdus sp.]
MQMGKACDETVTGEARVRIEGGLAHFPGRAKEQTISFGDLATPERQELTSLADQADFFGCEPATDIARPDARTYTVGLTIDGRSREMRLAEPIRDPAMAKLVSVVRRLSKQHPSTR